MSADSGAARQHLQCVLMVPFTNRNVDDFISAAKPHTSNYRAGLLRQLGVI